MRLWTWQKRGFHLADGSRRVKGLSPFPQLVADPGHFRQVYTKLYERLGTSQFHWYFTDESEAKGRNSHLQWFERDCLLWEVNVPSGEVFKIVCGIAWNCLLMKSVVRPRRLLGDWKRLSRYNRSLEEKWMQDFDDFWKSKSEEELWAALFLERCVDGCTDILLRHPIDDSCVEKDPIKDGLWWETYRGNSFAPKIHDCPLPCERCVGRIR